MADSAGRTEETGRAKVAIGGAWGGIRSLVREAFTFAEIKDLVGGSGLPVELLADLQQRPTGGASKSQLVDGIEILFRQVSADDKDRFVARCISTLLRKQPEYRQNLEDALQAVGWGLLADEPYPLALRIDIDLVTLPETAQEGLRTALRRYSGNDLDGAITAICGVVDSLTAAAYEQHKLGDHRGTSYRERITRSFNVKEAAYKAPLAAIGVPQHEVERLWQNQRGAVNQAAYVLAVLRSRFSDAHGRQPAPREVVQRALDVGVFVTRNLLGE